MLVPSIQAYLIEQLRYLRVGTRDTRDAAGDTSANHCSSRVLCMSTSSQRYDFENPQQTLQLPMIIIIPEIQQQKTATVGLIPVDMLPEIKKHEKVQQ